MLGGVLTLTRRLAESVGEEDWVGLGTGLVAVVADDDPDIRALLEMQLTRWEFTVHVAADGAEALDQIARHEPQLVLLDVSMPVRDGLEVLRSVREQLPGVENGGPAVVLVTARDGGQDVALGLEMGADDYVRKPFHVAELRQRLGRSVENARRINQLESVRRAVSQPRVLSVPGVHVAASTEPIDGAGAGGDLMVVTEAPGGFVVAVLGDAMGHGPGAAARAAYTRTLLSSTARYEAAPARILSLVNVAMGADPDATSAARDTEFVTACVVALHPETGGMRWASAGHSGPWLVHEGMVWPGEESGDVIGPPLGLGLEADFPERELALGVGDRLVMHSDALAVTGPDGSEFLADELPRLLVAAADESDEAMVARILEGLHAFDDGRHPDDVSVMVLGLAARDAVSAAGDTTSEGNGSPRG